MRTLAIFLLLATAAVAARAQSTVTFEWKGEVQPGQTIEVRNINGSIQAQTSTGNEVEVTVQITGSTPDPNSVRIDAVPHDGGVLLCTIYEGHTVPDHCTPNGSLSTNLNGSDIRVSYTVKVPAGVAFQPKTVNGNLSIDLPGSAVSAETVNGQILLTSGGPARASTVNGSILAVVGAITGTGTREFTAINGAVDLQIPGNAQASVQANTILGHITTDFGLPVHKALIGSWATGDLNGGGPMLVLGTVNGSIHLRKAIE